MKPPKNPSRTSSQDPPEGTGLGPFNEDPPEIPPTPGPGVAAEALQQPRSAASGRIRCHLGIDDNKACIQCTRLADAIPARLVGEYYELPCVVCGATLVLSPSANDLVVKNVGQPVCRPCLPNHPFIQVPTPYYAKRLVEELRGTESN